MRATLERLSRLTWAERRTLWSAWWLLLAAPAALRLLPLRTLLQWAQAPAGPRWRSSVLPERLAWVVAAAARRHPWGPGCLPRALVLRRLLAAHGLAGELRIGVRRHADRLSAHAWVEYGGRALSEPAGVDRFQPLLAPPVVIR